MSSSNSYELKLTLPFRLNWVTLPGMLFLAVLLLSVHTPDACAQIGQLRVGDRIRITAPLVLDAKIQGTVTELDKTVIVLAVKDSSFYIAESMILNLETSRGKKRAIGRGLVIGAVTGITMFGLASAFANNVCGSGDKCILGQSDGEAYLSGASIGLITGAAIGTITGFFIKVDMWERVPFRIAMDAEPVRSSITRNTVSPSISIRFSLNR